MTRIITPFISGFMSQWFPSPFTMDGVNYNCAEQYMMHAKAKLFGDADSSDAILKAEHPREQKALGRSVSGWDQALWDAEKYDIVLRASRAKFTQNPDLADKLLATGDEWLVEANHEDAVWGVALGMGDPRLQDPEKWRGENLLGKILMQVRDELRA